ncbi:hypothetical protein [Streptomyces jumonjinensis]|uniref:hypothetical protein n=1 Tax=Streptomyces jumonjinensis TaxID=1945 RepID=UPI0037BACA0D
MASIKNRENKDGTVTYTVLWRRAGGGRGAKQESEIFTDETAAERFRDLVNGHGQNWPPGWIRGQGFIADQRRPETMFEPYAMAHIERLTGVQGDTKATYKKPVLENMSPWFKPYTVEDGEGSIVREMVQDWVNDLENGRAAPLDAADRKPQRKYAAKTIANQHGLLSAILQAAVDAEPALRASNPCAKTQASPAGRRRYRGRDLPAGTGGVGVGPRVPWRAGHRGPGAGRGDSGDRLPLG